MINAIEMAAAVIFRPGPTPNTGSYSEICRAILTTTEPGGLNSISSGASLAMSRQPCRLAKAPSVVPR